MPVTESQLKKRIKLLGLARSEFRAAVAEPFKRAMLKHSPLAAADIIWQIPMEAAAAGFDVTTSQSVRLWTVEMAREIDGDLTLHVAGEAKSLFKALFQVVEAMERQIDGLESECRTALKKVEPAAEVAA